MLNFREIDLSKTTKEGGAGLEIGPTYLVLYRGQFHVGQFSEQWYGLNFVGIYDAGAQYDPPGENYSDWQRIWLFEDAADIAASEELAFAQRKRAYAIANKLRSNGQIIDETAPIEAFFYISAASAMTKDGDDDDEDFDGDDE